ncbi:hypothetical protein QUF74_16205 [Candidatus Halobeggiatoa sp. HSG11]|nr:hypothetical protein [Candidatus Halobeggiatoa sp. HSG11]
MDRSEAEIHHNHKKTHNPTKKPMISNDLINLNIWLVGIGDVFGGVFGGFTLRFYPPYVI